MNYQNNDDTCNLFFLVAIALLNFGAKLVGAIDVSWWLLLAPFWVPIVFAMTFLVILKAFTFGR